MTINVDKAWFEEMGRKLFEEMERYAEQLQKQQELDPKEPTTENPRIRMRTP